MEPTQELVENLQPPKRKVPGVPFKPGVDPRRALNAGGRPKGSKTRPIEERLKGKRSLEQIKEAARAQVIGDLVAEVRQYTPLMLDTLLVIAGDEGRKDSDRIAAVRTLLERGYGAPLQGIALDARVTTATAPLTIAQTREAAARVRELLMQQAEAERLLG